MSRNGIHPSSPLRPPIPASYTLANESVTNRESRWVGAGAEGSGPRWCPHDRRTTHGISPQAPGGEWAAMPCRSIREEGRAMLAALRTCRSPRRIIRSRASDLIERTRCSVHAFRFGVGRSSSPGGCPPGPSQNRARRFPPLGSSVERGLRSLDPDRDTDRGRGKRMRFEVRIEPLPGQAVSALAPAPELLEPQSLCPAQHGGEHPVVSIYAEVPDVSTQPPAERGVLVLEREMSGYPRLVFSTSLARRRGAQSSA